MFLFERAVLSAVPATFSPFDTGGLEEFLRPSDGSAWELADRAARLRHYSGDAAAVVQFAEAFVAGHCRTADSYVRSGQESTPDFPPYHGLSSPTGDRRAWTIEVRAHADVDVPPSRLVLRAIVLAERSLQTDVPDEFLPFVVVAESDDDGTGDVVKTTADLVLKFGIAA